MESSNRRTEDKDQAGKRLPFHERLRRERNLRAWSQADVAAKIESDTKTVSRWEQGRAFPTPYHRYKLLQLFGKSAQELGLTDEEINNEKEYSEESLSNRYLTLPPSLTIADALKQAKKELEEVEAANRVQAQEIDQAEKRAEQEYQMSQLEIERQRLELLEKRLEVQKRRVEYALEVAKKTIDTLYPNADEGTRAMLVQTLLPDFLQLLTIKGLELTLLESHSNEEKGTIAESD